MDNYPNGTHLRVGITAPPPQTAGSYTATNHFNMGLTLIDLLSYRLNFTYELFTSRSVGIQINGSWTGLVGLLLNKEIDLIADRVPILPKYIDEMDVSIPLGQDEWVTLQKYTSSRDSLSGLLSPFKIEVWILLAFSVIGMVPVMFLVYRLYLKFRPDAWNRFRGNLSDFVLFVVVSLLRQDHKLRISIHSQRVLMATWWIGGLVLTTFYTANLTASLARPFRAKSVEHPSELSQPAYKEVKWLTLQDKPLFVHVQDENGMGFLRALRQDVQQGRGILVDSVQDAANLTESQGYVWFGERETLLQVLLTNYKINRAQNVSRTNLCNFLITDKSYMTVEYGLAFSKNSTLTEPFNQALTKIDQSGILEFLRRPSFAGKNPCSLTGGYTSRPMQLEDFFGLFYIVGVGLGFSSAVFLAEKLGFSIRNWWRRKRTVPVTVTAATPPPIPLEETFVAREQEPQHYVQVIVPSSEELLAIEQLTEEIDHLLDPAYDYRGILRGFIYTK